MARVKKTEFQRCLWLLIIGGAALLQDSTGHQVSCKTRITIIDSAEIDSNDQEHLRKFSIALKDQLTGNLTVIATNYARYFTSVNASHNATKLFEGIDQALLLPKSFSGFLLIVTNWNGDDDLNMTLKYAAKAREHFTVGVVNVVNSPRQQEPLLQVVGGQESRFIHVESYGELQEKVNETVQMICPGVPTMCAAKLKIDESLILNITCRTPEQTTSITRNATNNLLRCWEILKNSNTTIMIDGDDNMNMCVQDSTVLHHNCSLSTHGLEQHKIVTILNRLDDNCTDHLSEFYRKVNDYHTPCPSNTKHEIADLLGRIDIAQVDWAEINNLALLCLLPSEYCNRRNVGLENRILNLTADPECHFFKNLNSQNKCCNWDCGCRKMLLESNPTRECNETIPECSSSEPQPLENPRQEHLCETLERGESPEPSIIGGKCNRTALEGCYDQGFDILTYMEHQNCSCESVRIQIAASLRKCANLIIPDEKDLQELAQNDTQKKSAEIAVYANRYTGPVETLLNFKAFAQVLPRQRVNRLTIQDIDNVSTSVFVALPVSKKLALTRQTFSSLAFTEVRKEIESNFQSKGCGFVSSINISVLIKPGIMSLDLALGMCACSEQESEHIPATMDILCKTIFTKTKTLQKLMDIQERLCPLCYAFILKNRPAWQKEILGDEKMKDSACDKFGQRFSLPTTVLSQWAVLCNSPSKVGHCNNSRPSLMLHGPSLPSVADLVLCKDVFCHRLCHLTETEIDAIRNTLNHQSKEDVGCLAYLDDTIPQPVRTTALDATDISGSCRLKSKVTKRAIEAGHLRTKRSHKMSCSGITEDIKYGIAPSDVLDVKRIEADLGADPYHCVKKNNLGDYHWDIDQAKAIMKHVRHRRSLYMSDNWTNLEVGVLGFIGLGFTSNELENMAGISNIIYGTFGATYGWSPEQLRTLARRYLTDNSISESEPYRLKYFDIARLNHLVCGLPAQFVTKITTKAIIDATPILGKIQRCEFEVLEVLARHLILYYGPVINWPDDHFSEFGIMLAGVSGDHLRDVGLRLTNYVTVPFINHISPKEFRKLTAQQTSLLGYDVSLALSRRGLCSWLTPQQKQGYLEHLCAGSATVAPFYICSLILLTLAISISLW